MESNFCGIIVFSIDLKISSRNRFNYKLKARTTTLKPKIQKTSAKPLILFQNRFNYKLGRTTKSPEIQATRPKITMFNFKSFKKTQYTCSASMKCVESKKNISFLNSYHLSCCPYTAWWDWNLIEKKSPRIAECRFGYPRVCSSIIYNQQNHKTYFQEVILLHKLHFFTT